MFITFFFSHNTQYNFLNFPVETVFGAFRPDEIYFSLFSLLFTFFAHWKSNWWRTLAHTCNKHSLTYSHRKSTIWEDKLCNVVIWGGKFTIAFRTLFSSVRTYTSRRLSRSVYGLATTIHWLSWSLDENFFYCLFLWFAKSCCRCWWCSGNAKFHPT